MTHHAKKFRLVKSEMVDAINLREFFSDNLKTRTHQKLRAYDTAH
jgi:hypothetical protein